MLKNYSPQRHRGTEKSQNYHLFQMMRDWALAVVARVKFGHICANVAGVIKFISVPLYLCGESFALKGFGNEHE